MTLTNEPVEAIIFDLDGTLIDSAPDIAAAVNKYLAEAGYDALETPTIERFIGNGPHRLLLDVFGLNGHPTDDAAVEAAYTTYLANYRQEPATHTVFFPHVVEDLKLLKEAGIRIGICTNKPHEMTELVLEALGIAPLIECAIGADAVPNSKPDPGHLMAVATEMALTDGAWVYVGDTKVDQLTATGAGVPFYAVPWGGGAELEVSHSNRLTRLSDLLTLAQNHSEKAI